MSYYFFNNGKGHFMEEGCKWNIPIMYSPLNYEGWVSKHEFGFYLPFLKQSELYEAIHWLREWRDFYCFRYVDESHKNMKELFEYFPVNEIIGIKEKITDLVQDRHIVSIRFSIGMRLLNEK